MKCPIDQVELSMTDRQGIEIDYCPQCRGVWLDRGELDKLIERSTATAKTPAVPIPPPAPAAGYQESRYSERPAAMPYSDKQHGYSHKRKKESFLGDLFDF